MPEGLSLSGLHDVIQEVMGWTDSHLHDFHWREERFGIPDPEFDEERVVDERTVTLKELGLYGFLVGLEIVTILTIGFVYMWIKGALDWE